MDTHATSGRSRVGFSYAIVEHVYLMYPKKVHAFYLLPSVHAVVPTWRKGITPSLVKQRAVDGQLDRIGNTFGEYTFGGCVTVRQSERYWSIAG